MEPRFHPPRDPTVPAESHADDAMVPGLDDLSRRDERLQPGVSSWRPDRGSPRGPHGHDIRATQARIQELFKLVGMTADRSEGYPHEFSGGMKQRAMIAMALACKPDLIIADEPTTALDVIMQDRILGEIRDLQRELDLAMMIITHDISVV